MIRDDLENEIMFPSNQLKGQMEFSMAVNQRKIFLNEDVTEDSIFKCMYYLNKLIALDKITDAKPAIEICVNTNGGLVHDCFTLISYIEHLKDIGYEIITTNIGRAFSAGFLISICGSKRQAYRYARYMYHDISGGMFGKQQSMKEYLEETEKIDNMAIDLVTKYTSITKEELEELNQRKIDKFYSAQELKELNGVDIII